MRNFLHDELWIGHSGDGEDDDPCLSEALLPVSDEFDSLSCLCDADSFILVALTTTVSSSAHQPNPHPCYNCLRQPNDCTVNVSVGSGGTATTSCRRRPLVIDSD